MIYRPPDSSTNEFISELETITSKINRENKNCYLLGDFNINLLNVETHELTGQFLDCIYSSYLTPLITKPTRITCNNSTLIDNIFTNVIDEMESLNGLICADISDHTPIFHIRKQKKECKKHEVRQKTRCINKDNISSFTQEIKNIDWHDIIRIEDPNKAI